jgi:Na+/alanine symporter
MALPTMIAVLSLSGKVRAATKEYFSKKENQQLN